MSEKPETTNTAFIDQVKKYVNAKWPIEPFDCINLFEDRCEIDKWLATIPEHLRNRLQDNHSFHPIKLLMLLESKKFWTEEKIASQNWSRGVGFRTGLTLTYPESYPGKVQLPIAIDGDSANPQVLKTLQRVISQFNLQDFVPIQHTPHGGLHILLCAYVDPNNLDEIELWEKKKSLTEGAGAWLNGAKCAIKINCQQVTLFPTLHRKDGSSYRLNKVIPLGNTSWVLDKIVEAFINDGLLECSPEEYHAKLEEKIKADYANASYKEFDISEWFELTEDEIAKTANIILGTDGEDFGPIYCYGNRHNNTMAIAGACAWSHISQDATERLFKALIDRSEDQEPEDRFNVIKETYQRIQNQRTVQGRTVMIELFRAAHKSRDISAATNRFEQFLQALGLGHKKIRKNLNVAGFLRACHGDYVRLHDVMISGFQESEKMITGIKTRCHNCNTNDQMTKLKHTTEGHTLHGKPNV